MRPARSRYSSPRAGATTRRTRPRAARPRPARRTGRSAGDLKIVNYALTLEYLEAEFYKDVIASGQIKDKPTAELAKKFGQTEQEHVDALTAVVKKLGGTPATKPKTNFEPVIDGGAKKILSTAATVENLGAAAYLGQAGNIKSAGDPRRGPLHPLRSRRATPPTLNTALGKSATPDGAFAKPADDGRRSSRPSSRSSRASSSEQKGLRHD